MDAVTDSQMRDLFGDRYLPDNTQHLLFMTWIRGVLEMVYLAVERRELTLALCELFRIEAAKMIYAEHESRLQEIGYHSPKHWYEEHLIPMEQVFLQQNDELIARELEIDGQGPAGALAHYQDLIFSQQGHVPDDELQVMFDALKADGALIEASQQHRDHVAAIARRLISRGLAAPHTDPNELMEYLWAEARKAAMGETGPARRKERGPTARQPKRFEDAFGFNLARENLRKWARTRTGLEEDRVVDTSAADAMDDEMNVDGVMRNAMPDEGNAMDPDMVTLLLQHAEKYCTATERTCLKAKYADGLSYAQIARQRGVGRSSVQQAVRNAKRKIGAHLEAHK